MASSIQKTLGNPLQSTRRSIGNYERNKKMSNSLLFNFTVNKEAKTVFIKREFAAELSLVWDAFTKQEILDQWWAPKPWISKTKYMDFKVGGRRFYAMVSSERLHYSSLYRS